MLQGTASHVGKSVLCTALCRILSRDGWRVAPFKAQNMALNAYVTYDGGEIGRAQGVQAEAAGVMATVRMNPILLKPKRDTVAQVIVLGKAVGDMKAGEYGTHYLPTAFEVIKSSLTELRREYEVVVIEGAGSPAEINLRERDIANMRVAEAADCPVILVADIDRGGVFASILGTLELLTPSERDRIAGFIINKFRGDIELLKPGLRFIEEETSLPVLGVIPYAEGLGIAQEDSVSLGFAGDSGGWTRDSRPLPGIPDSGTIDIAVVRLPHISNFDDFDPLAWEPDVRVRFVSNQRALGTPDVVILPGTKNTAEDLLYLYESGFARQVASLKEAGISVVGVCGGFQMMGKALTDSSRIESEIERIDGLGLFPFVTEFHPDKIVHRVRAKVVSNRGFLSDLEGDTIEGYEIHAGVPVALEGSDGEAEPLFALVERSGRSCDELDGVVTEDGLVFGTHIHGLFDNDRFRRSWLNHIRRRKGLPSIEEKGSPGALEIRERMYDGLAELVRRSVDMTRVYSIIGLTEGR